MMCTAIAGALVSCERKEIETPNAKSRLTGKDPDAGKD